MSLSYPESKEEGKEEEKEEAKDGGRERKKAMWHDDVDDAFSVRHWCVALSSACCFEVEMKWERCTPT